MLEERLKALRESNGKSQIEVCAALHIEQSTLANYENGRRTPKIEVLIKLAEYYNVSTDYLFGLADIDTPNCETSKAENTEVLLESEIGKTLINYFSKLSKPNKYIIVGEIMKLFKNQEQEERDAKIR